VFCCQRGETALQLAKRSDCDDIANLIAARKKVVMNSCSVMLLVLSLICLTIKWRHYILLQCLISMVRC